MTAFRIIEEDQGTYTRNPHPHNGYYAGDFNASNALLVDAMSTSLARTVGRPSNHAAL